MRPTWSMRAAIGTLIVATSIIQFANGFFGTFVSLRIALEGFAPTLAGLVLSSYFAGFTVGAVRCGPIIERIGHIRAYAAFGGLAAAATAAMPFLVGPLLWMVLRAVIGFGCAGLFITTESWLNAKAPPESRGRVFSFYMVGTFAALAAGQLLIGVSDIESVRPFNAIVALFSVALVMVSTTRAEPPQATAAPTLPFGQLTRTAPVAVVGCALQGMIAGTFYALVPAWMQGEGIDRSRIALFMFVAVVGGLIFQMPVGHLSDRLDRRRVLAALGVGFAVVAIALIRLSHTLAVVATAAALLGGFLSTLYPVCIAHAHDCMPADRVVSVSARLILVSGVGSVVGPLIGTRLMASYDIDGVFYFMAATALSLATVASWGSLGAVSPRHQARPFDILPPQATPLAHAPRESRPSVETHGIEESRPTYQR
ncbi:MAG TPA: MFS transporter [Methylomirabilota bacterium]|nr:MFS transporter [Methylomirabilota bacterium]